MGMCALTLKVKRTHTIRNKICFNGYNGYSDCKHSTTTFIGFLTIITMDVEHQP
jgi:hypothetical protein